jgi:hypothetical protein
MLPLPLEFFGTGIHPIPILVGVFLFLSSLIQIKRKRVFNHMLKAIKIGKEQKIFVVLRSLDAGVL